MPGLAAPAARGGIGFDYRFAMGIPDNWIKLIKEVRDEDWPMGHLWYELNNRRPDEKTISYSESHDQARVGDQSIIFRLVGADMYWHMSLTDDHMGVDRGLALHKMIRLITLATAGHGYLNFMGNEFGHPEWIDFPREGNQWSYHYARRQWYLVDDPNLKYHLLADFDRFMIQLARSHKLYRQTYPYRLYEHDSDNVLAMQRAGLVFVFNFHPHRSYTDYRIPAPAGEYKTVLDTDQRAFGGHQRLDPDQVHHSLPGGNEQFHYLSLYLPSRSAQVLHRVVSNESP
jgi:1,4-alpha-glucan branching enzyme